MQRLRLVMRVALNFVRFAFLKIIYLFRFKNDPIQFIAISSSIRIQNNGSIMFEGRNMVEPNVLFHADGGTIHLYRNFINRNCMIVSKKSIIIGEGTTIGPNVCIYDHDHGNGGFISSSINIGKNVWIGANAVILKGVTIGDGAVIGAGTVVTHNVEPNAVVVGSEMRKIR